MESHKIAISQADVARLIEDVAAVRDALESLSMGEDPEGELSDWAKEQLREARASKDKISQEEVERMLLGTP